MTNNSIDVIVRFRVKPGKLELYKQAMDFILSTAEAKEPYVLEYNIYKNAEGVYTQYERYADEAALHRHLEVTKDGQIKWAETTEIEQVIILGDMSERFGTSMGTRIHMDTHYSERLNARESNEPSGSLLESWGNSTCSNNSNPLFAYAVSRTEE